MCGVVAYVPDELSPKVTAYVPDRARVKTRFERLVRESLVRGMHAYGIFQKDRAHRALTISEGIIEHFDPGYPAIAHCRYSTSGDWRDSRNNQPLVLGAVALVFNGVISQGTREEFELEFGVTCETDNDGEVLLRVMEQGRSPEDFILTMDGSFAGCWMKDGIIWAARNARRPLWVARTERESWVASTRDIFRRAGFDDVKELPVGVTEL